MTTTRTEGFGDGDLAAFPRDPGRRYELVDGTIVISAPGGLTRADRDALPPIGARQELLDGQILVNAAPNTRHQSIVLRCLVLLDAARPHSVKVLPGPFDVAIGSAVIEPDIVVARRTDVTEKDLPTAPLLAVEVLSPRTRWVDLGRKRDHLQAAGCPSYWVIDPGVRTPPTLTVLELVNGAYVEVARVTGDQAWVAQQPFPVTVVPADLLDE